MAKAAAGSSKRARRAAGAAVGSEAQPEAEGAADTGAAETSTSFDVGVAVAELVLTKTRAAEDKAALACVSRVWRDASRNRVVWARIVVSRKHAAKLTNESLKQLVERRTAKQADGKALSVVELSIPGAKLVQELPRLGPRLRTLNLNGCIKLSSTAVLNRLTRDTPELKRLDLGGLALSSQAYEAIDEFVITSLGPCLQCLHDDEGCVTGCGKWVPCDSLETCAECLDWTICHGCMAAWQINQFDPYNPFVCCECMEAIEDDFGCDCC